ncbi:hypothetical protein V2I01_36265 [Micromonospora sp. BRA006-A]|nr:hypothetical protein [Micromonospora sp. BRA006-A]
MVAGLNSTIAITHREEDRYGFLGEAQSSWVRPAPAPLPAVRLAAAGRDGARAGGAQPVRRRGAPDPVSLRDRGSVNRLVGPMLNLLLSDAAPSARVDPVVPLAAAPATAGRRCCGSAATG